MISNRIQSIFLFPVVFSISSLLNIEKVHADNDLLEAPGRTVNNLPEAPVGTSPDSPRGPGGTRPELSSNCPAVENPLTAITPINGNGNTTSEYPTFWFYIPYKADDVDTVDFKLLDNDEKQTLHRTSVQLSHMPGILSITLSPETSYLSSQPHPLEQDMVYKWYLMLNCHSDGSTEENGIRENDFELTGWISRTTLNSNYRWNGVWYDELNRTASLYQANHQDRIHELNWLELLESVELEHLQTEPLLE